MIVVISAGAYLYVGPPVRAWYTSAFREEKIFIRIRVMKDILIGDIACITMKCNASIGFFRAIFFQLKQGFD